MSPREVNTLPNLLLTSEEVAAVLKCSTSQVVKMLARGVIPSVKLGGLRRVRLRELEDLINGLEQQRGTRRIPLASERKRVAVRNSSGGQSFGDRDR